MEHGEPTRMTKPDFRSTDLLNHIVSTCKHRRWHQVDGVGLRHRRSIASSPSENTTTLSYELAGNATMKQLPRSGL
jgi:hypothetical protein